MSTKVIGIKEFRQNFTFLWRKAIKEKIRYIIMYHAKPMLELTPLDKRRTSIEALAKEIAEARKQVKKGKVYTEKEVYKTLGL